MTGGGANDFSRLFGTFPVRILGAMAFFPVNRLECLDRSTEGAVLVRSGRLDPVAA